jgi:hypothetical protein
MEMGGDDTVFSLSVHLFMESEDGLSPIYKEFSRFRLFILEKSI